jgi:hypothetical protein
VSLRAQLQRLGRALGGKGPCHRNLTTCLVVGDAPVPPDAPRCPGCGEVHVLRETLVVVKPSAPPGGVP